jgi:hypothetical protein
LILEEADPSIADRAIRDQAEAVAGLAVEESVLQKLRHGELGSTVTAQMTQFSPRQQEAALLVIERMAWGDMDNAIRDTETTLRLAMDATRAEFLRWQEELGPASPARARGYDCEVRLTSLSLHSRSVSLRRC